MHSQEDLFPFDYVFLKTKRKKTHIESTWKRSIITRTNTLNGSDKFCHSSLSLTTNKVNSIFFGKSHGIHRLICQLCLHCATQKISITAFFTVLLLTRHTPHTMFYWMYICTCSNYWQKRRVLCVIASSVCLMIKSS